jgi:serine/threonine-protein kinase
MELSKRIGDYEILEELGRGGMGRVYRVRNVLSDRIEAMKVLLPDLVGRQDLASRFLREIKLLAALDHPNIAALRTALTVDNQLVMIMEYVEGQSLAERLRRGAIPIPDAINYIEQGLVALSYAHAQHVVHRDIKPANMMLTADGDVKLMDFGIARQRDDQTLTVAGTTTGSLSYMSPEQVNGEKTDARSDLYSMGISLYELVTGQRPFRADSDFAVMVAHLKEMPRPPIELKPELGRELNALILTSIAKDPAARFQSADEFRAALVSLHTAPTTVGLGGGALGGFPGEPTRRLPVEAAPTLLDPPTVPVATGTPKTVPPLPPPSPPPVPPMPAMAMPPTVVKTGHPAVYVVLGGVLVIAALVGAGLYIGRADAEPGAPTATPAPAPAAPAPAPAPATAVAPPATATPGTPATASTLAATTDPAVTPAATVPSVPAAASVAPTTAATTPGNALTSSTAAPSMKSTMAPAAGKPTASRPASTNTAAPASRPAMTEPAAQPTPAAPAVDFDEMETDVDQLLTRASAINSSLDTLRQEQARMGLNLRGDIASRQEAMNQNLTRAREAVAQRNVTRLQRFKALAEGDIETLEKFLGR